MKQLLFSFLMLSLSVFSLSAQNASLTGAWTLQDGDDTHQLFFQDGFCFHTIHQGKEYKVSQGGSYETANGTLKVKMMYNSGDAEKVGQEMNLPFSINGDQLQIEVSGNQAKFNRVDNGKAPLAGVWRITGRAGEDGKVADIHQTGSRQTYKMLTGSKFQWVAIDPEKKQFSGTGGGSYTFKDGKYTENIEFFSRDNSRVGASLSFDGKLDNGKWHHSGLSSKGDKIYEVWSRVKL